MLDHSEAIALGKATVTHDVPHISSPPQPDANPAELRLWHRPGSRSERVLWLLEELEVPYHLEILSRDESRMPAHRRRHPLGRVPVLEIGDISIFESAAICLYLADVHRSSGLLPASGAERAHVMQWTVFAVSELDARVLGALGRASGDSSSVREPVDEAIAAIAAALEDTDQLAGATFTIADLMCATALDAIRKFGLAPLPSRIENWLESMYRRPARMRALQISAARG